MSYFDLRYAALPVVNILKSYTAMTWEWDPFGIVIGNFTWIKFWLLTSFFFLFSFISIEIPLTPQVDMGYIRIQLKNYSVSLLVCFLASLFFPQDIFWCIYPTILLLSFCTARISSMWRSFKLSVQLLLPTIPVLNISMTTTTNIDEEPDIELLEMEQILQV
ncbi:unnamed protein product [Fraxinus pennsylvanica]|uniref:Uncharacterized protein n=1 Tax=Fraxinus pennsylvanica TaxID=56036 RepID=A0AAD1ZTN9_9LAMI|nr:unnamed protein product [Fraxinus pennsylvanica]